MTTHSQILYRHIHKIDNISEFPAVVDNVGCCFIAAGGHAHGCEEDSALQAGEPWHVRVGDQGPATGAEDLRP